jgi:N utilization substance protein A
LAVVGDNQLSLAIGKQGLNVRLANRLADWSIDVKTEDQFAEMDVQVEMRKGIDALFNEDHFEDQPEEEEEFVEVETISDIPEIDRRYVNILKRNGIELIEDYINKEKDELIGIPGISESVVDELNAVINEYVDIIEEESEADAEHDEIGEAEEKIDSESAYSAEEAAASEEPDQPASDDEELSEADEAEEETYECPECGQPITLDMSVCPHCGVGLSFEFAEEDEESAEDEENEQKDSE